MVFNQSLSNAKVHLKAADVLHVPAKFYVYTAGSLLKQVNAEKSF